jgi:hypothetical protein
MTVRLVSESRPIVTLLRQYALGSTGFQAVLFLLQQNRRYEIRILAYLPRLDITMTPNVKCRCISRNFMEHIHVAI